MSVVDKTCIKQWRISL